MREVFKEEGMGSDMEKNDSSVHRGEGEDGAVQRRGHDERRDDGGKWLPMWSSSGQRILC